MARGPGKTTDEAGQNGGAHPFIVGQSVDGADVEQASPEEQIAELLGSLPPGSQVALYRSAPVWAEGHLQTLVIEPGAGMDLARIDEISRYWGGGTYQFRPVVRGRWTRGARTLRLDGPTLWQGQPHHNDPRRQQREREAPAYEMHHYPPQVATMQGLQPPPGQPRPDQLQTLLGSMLERLDARMGAMETALRTPPVPANTIDPNQTIINSLRLAKEIGNYFQGGHQDEDEGDDEDEGEAEPAAGIENLLERFLTKKLDEDGPKPKTPRAATPRPTLIRAPSAGAERAERVEPRAEPARATVPNPSGDAGGDMLSMFQMMKPADQARLYFDVGNSLSPQVVAELRHLVQPGDDAGADDPEGEDDPAY